MAVKRMKSKADSKPEATQTLEDFQESFSGSQTNNQLIKLYDNLAAYSDYLMRLTQHQEGNTEKATNRDRLFNKAGNQAGLALVKKSNDIKGRFLGQL